MTPDDASLPVLASWTAEQNPDAADPRLVALRRALAEHPGDDILLAASHWRLDESRIRRWHQRLRQAPAAVEGIAILNNRQDRFNPFRDHPQPPLAPAAADPASLVAWLGQGALVSAAEFPNDLILLRSRTAARLAQAEQWPAGHDPGLQGYAISLCDECYCHDPGQALFISREAARWQAPPSESFAGLSSELRRLVDGGCWSLPPALAERPCLLHITHSWGGGINRWLNDWWRHESHHQQLILRSHGDWQRARHGSELGLYLASPEWDQPLLLRRFYLTPAITATRLADSDYRAILGWIIARYSVARILVSSLIGHSLDALTTGLPTLQALHDYYPAWPLLTVNPLPYEQSDGSFKLQQAIDEHPQREFSEDDEAIWQRLRHHWCRLSNDPTIRLAAPTRHAAELIQRLNPELRQTIAVIGHGLPAWEQPREVAAPPVSDQRLRLVIPGRLMSHKGLHLLREALPRLQAYARITLLGCDRDGMTLLGQPGVDIIAHYEHQQMPARLATIRPDAALLLSVVPETYSYTLSELWSLNIVPIATRLGSFAERIESGSNGLLIEPDADALVAAVAALHEDRQPLIDMRQTIASQQPQSMATMLQQYEALWPATNIEAPAVLPALPMAAEVAELSRSNLWLRDERDDLTRIRSELHQQLQERTQWARRSQRQLEQLNQSMQQQRQQLQTELERRQQQVEQLQQAFQQEQQTLLRTAERLRGVEQQLVQTQSDLSHEQQLHQILQHQHQQVLNSRSWRLTKPLRVVTRSGRNLYRARVHLPWRWPLLFKRLLQSLFSRGLSGTLRRLQDESTQGGAVVTPDRQPLHSNQAIEPVTINGAATPALAVLIELGDDPAILSAQLRQAAALAEQRPLQVILLGAPTAAVQDYLNQCQGLLHSQKYVAGDHTDGQDWRRAIALAKDVLQQVEITPSSRWLLLQRCCEPLDDSCRQLLSVLDQQTTTAMVCAMLVDHQHQVISPATVSPTADEPRFRAMEHPLNQYRRSLAMPAHGLLAVDEQRLPHEAVASPAADEPFDHIDIDIDIDIEVNGDDAGDQPEPTPAPVDCLLVPDCRCLWSGDNESAPANPPAIIDSERPSILIIDAWVPTPDQDSGSLRMVNLLGLLQEMGWQVVFCAADRSHRGRYTQDLQSLGIEVWYHPYLHDFKDFLSRHGSRFSAVILSRYYVAQEILPLVRRHCPLTPVIFDTVDLHFLREEREAEVKQSKTLKRLAATTRKHELALVDDCEITLVVSPEEQKLLRHIRPLARVEVLSNIHRLHGCRQGYEQRRDLMFVGGFQHPPNIDAVQWFIAEVWPAIHTALPEARFRVIGSKMPDEIKQLQAPNVDVLGFVEDLEPHLDECRLSIAPLRYGAGVKGKVNSSMSYGQPVVATTVAVEGMGLEDGSDVLVADDAQAFAEAVIRLYQDEALWQRLSQAGMENIRRHFSREAALERLRAILPDSQKSG
ncbi:MAG: hypothetical protein Tsb002_36660 [Wenzhouxiangellaceae bacterium]